MRNLLIALCLFATSQTYGAVNNMLSNYSLATDTCVDAGTAYLDYTLTGVYQQVSVQVVLTEISGTSAGTVILQASLDGTNYNSIGADTLATADVASQSHVFIVPNTPYKYWRVLQTGSGTMSSKITATIQTVPLSSFKHVVYEMLDAAGLADDTVANSATGYITYPLTDYYEQVAIQAVATKLSGTAGGTVTVQGSINGTNYVTVKAAYITSSTLTVLNQTTTSKIFVVTGSPYKYYRLSYTGTGTMSVKIRGYILPSRDNGR